MSRLFHTAIVLLLALGMIAPNASAAPSDFSCANVTEIPQTECQALLAFYKNDNGPNWWYILGHPWLVN